MSSVEELVRAVLDEVENKKIDISGPLVSACIIAQAIEKAAVTIADAIKAASGGEQPCQS